MPIRLMRVPPRQPMLDSKHATVTAPRAYLNEGCSYSLPQASQVPLQIPGIPQGLGACRALYRPQGRKGLYRQDQHLWERQGCCWVGRSQREVPQFLEHCRWPCSQHAAQWPCHPTRFSKGIHMPRPAGSLCGEL